MATVLTHPAVTLAIGLGLGKDVVPNPLLIAGVAVSALPDLNVLAFRQLYGNSTIMRVNPKKLLRSGWIRMAVQERGKNFQPSRNR